MDAVKIIRDANWRLDVGDITREQYEELIAPLRDVETVRHGRWIEDPDDWECQCSECRHISSCRTVYCSACGARMDGDGNE